jgi:hypothetical protein
MKRHGGSLLVIGALVLLGAAGGIVYWLIHRNQQSCVMVFHWIPGPAPLKILDRDVEDKPEDIAKQLDPRLLDLLHEMNIGGGQAAPGRARSFFRTSPPPRSRSRWPTGGPRSTWSGTPGSSCFPTGAAPPR